jgi:6-phosphofructokinase 1
MPIHEHPAVECLGAPAFESPLLRKRDSGFVDDAARIRAEVEIALEASERPELLFEKAGPRKRIFFDPARTTAAVVTCGGLSPGLNNVIRGVYHELNDNYGVHRVLGIRSGYRGLDPESGLEPWILDRTFVQDVNYLGGSVLGSSRGHRDPAAMVDFLEQRGIDLLFCVGGDGTQRGAHAICEELRERRARKSVVGIPKTIDNDIPYVGMSFGYVTALEKAAEVIRAAHVEARGAPNGIAVVKVMGRDSGFIAASAAVVSHETDYVLVPEVAFPLQGEAGFLAALEERIRQREHAVIVVAEGAGQHLFDTREERRDASGNVLHEDIGPFLCERIRDHFGARGIPFNLKYLDPSYLIRSIPANAWDCFLSEQMARNAVHAAMAGKTDVMIGLCHLALIHLPIATAVAAGRKHLDPTGDLWAAVLAATGQPDWK